MSPTGALRGPGLGQTQAVSSQRHGPGEVRVSAEEQGVQPVDLRHHAVHDVLAVGGAAVVEEVQQGVSGKVPQAGQAGQGDPLDVPGGEREVGRRGLGWAGLGFSWAYLPAARFSLTTGLTPGMCSHHRKDRHRVLLLSQ